LQKIDCLKKIKPSFIPAIIWLIITSILLTLPGSSLPQNDWLSKWLDKIWFDKWVHIGLFAIMVFLWCWAMLSKYSTTERLKFIFVRLSIIWFTYGVGMEFVQKYFIPDRSFDVKDIMADAAGCLVGVVYSISRYIKK
jgi:VanZ like family